MIGEDCERRKSCRSMGMCRSKKDGLPFCYNGALCWKSSRWNELIAFTEFGLYVDKHGDLSRGI